MKAGSDIAVVGAGIAGLAAALALAREPAVAAGRIVLVDGAPRPAHDAAADISLRVSAISAGSVAMLDALGAWRHVPASRACRYERMRVWDEADPPDGAATLRFDADEFGVPELGFIVENELLRHALLEELEASGIERLFGEPIASLDRRDGGWLLLLEGGRELSPGLLIGADGGSSFVRSAAGIDVQRHSYEQTAFVTHLRPERGHGHTARQRFLADGPLGMLPLADGRISVVWSTRPEAARRALEASAGELGEMLTEASDHVLGRLAVDGPRGSFPLAARHARQYVVPGLALIGDAAHAIHPLAGQGANLGLQDARVLADTVAAAIAAGEHPGDRPVLRRYERARRGANAAMLHFLTGLNRLFGSELPMVRSLRRTGMRAFNASGPIRRRAVAVALGME